ncbi:MAG TPA: N-acetyl-gamma-glutamyl-phosphate reductase [Granulicella sp.]
MTTTLTQPELEQRTTQATAPHIAIAGVSGYAGAELARLLLHHPRLAGTTPTFYGRAGETKLPTLAELHPQLAFPGHKADQLLPFDWDDIVARSTGILFLALPHEQSREYAPLALERGIRVVDLSGAWRLKDPANAAVYKLADADPALGAKLQEEAVFGSPELHAAEIASARLVANPGCYATNNILAMAPLVRAGLVDVEHGIIFDSKSGVSGAGKAPTANTHFMYAADNLSTYKVFGHRHTGELLEQLGLTTEQVQFTPHLLPIPRGILSTIYVRLKEKTTPEAITKVFADFYGSAPMVRLHDTPNMPQIQHVVRSNYCDIGFELAKDGKRLVVVSCLDNLLKGAAGQAVQNMNLMLGWPEQEGLL